MPTYLAVLKSTPRGFRATFPDLPAVRAEGATLEAVRVEAQAALEEHLAGNASSAAEPRTLDQIAPLAPGAVVLALGVHVARSKAVRINITIPEDLLAAVDRAAEAHSMSRSRFLALGVEALVAGGGHAGGRRAAKAK
jgi:predicted RNase H-like HicB family nuclease